MKLKITICIICTFMLSLQLIAQRTVTNKGYGGRIVEQYNVNANGNRHGVYKTWNKQGRLIKNYNYLNGELHGNCLLYFDNGTVKEESTYYKGTVTSLKVYMYEGGKRKLIRDATWDKLGNVLIDGDNAGKLPNGRWRFNYPSYGDYSETYNCNDTLYVWDDRDKQRFLGKYLDGIFIEHKSHIDIELAIRDSVRTKKYLEYENSKTYYRNRDSIATLSDSYYDAFIHHFEGNEQQFYTFLQSYLQTGKDKILKELIIDALDLSYITDISNLQFHIRGKSNNGAELEVLVGNRYMPILGSCKYRSSRYTLESLQRNGYEIPETQSKLLKVLQYANEHKSLKE